MKCDLHPRYKGTRAPKVPCVECWTMFIISNTSSVGSKDLRNLSKAICRRLRAS